MTAKHVGTYHSPHTFPVICRNCFAFFPLDAMCGYQQELRSWTLAIPKLCWWLVLFPSQLFLQALTVVNKFSEFPFHPLRFTVCGKVNPKHLQSSKHLLKGSSLHVSVPPLDTYWVFLLVSKFYCAHTILLKQFQLNLEVCIPINNGR